MSSRGSLHPSQQKALRASHAERVQSLGDVHLGAGRRVSRERRGVEARRFAWLLGAGAVVRALCLLPVARDSFWRSTALFALLAATLLTIAAATIVVSSADSPVVSDTA